MLMNKQDCWSLALWIAGALPLALAGGCGGQAEGSGPEVPLLTGGTGATIPPITSTTPPVTTAGNGASTTPITPPPTAAGVSGSVTPPPLAAAGTGGSPAVVPTAGSAGSATPPPAAGAGGAPATNSQSLYNATTGELPAPPMGEGIQISTTAFDLPAGAEQFKCFHSQIPVDGSEIDVRYYESKMAKGSHHFILYKDDGNASPVGTMDNTGCLTNFQGWIYSSAQPHVDLAMPDGVAMVLAGNQRVQFDMHYINTSTETLHASVTLNVTFAKGTFTKAASLISYNTSIFIPAHGMQTVGGDCTPGSGAKFFYMLTHTHRRGQLATINRVLAGGTQGEMLVKSTDWENPDQEKWPVSPYLTFQPGEKFHYSCQYMNDLNQVVTSGPSAQTNEMCMAITYYFPASAGGSCN
jgi:hypothetical protein